MYAFLKTLARLAAALLLLAIATAPARAAYATIHNFTGPFADGANAVGALVQDPATGNYYGTTQNGGKNNLGCVYCMTPNFAVTDIHDFAGPDGSGPTSTLILVGNAAGAPPTLYGTALQGGRANFGTVFKLFTTGAGFAVLHSFAGAAADGANPFAGVILASNGKLYGTTLSGGKFNMGTLYSLTPAGAGYGILHNFKGSAGSPVDGARPYARVFEFAHGFLVGTTAIGGNANGGTAYTVGLGGAGYVIIHSFVGGGGDGLNPTAELITGPTAAGAAILYGTTVNGGKANMGTAYQMNPGGGAFAIVYSFTGPDGANPWAALVFHTGTGNLYGTTFNGGAFGLGTVYALKIVAAPPFPEAVFHSFSGGFGPGPDGANPYAALIQSVVDNNLYGTTYKEGTALDGTIFMQSP